MIVTDCNIVVDNGKSTADKNIIVYRGDFNIQVTFSITQNDGYSYLSSSNNRNLITSTNASYAQMIVKLQNSDDIIILTEAEPTEDGKVTLTIIREYIDELVEVGSYDYQIRLFSGDKQARITIPPVEGQLIVKSPIMFLDDSATINLASIDSAVLLEDLEEEDLTFDSNGAYNKSEWLRGSVITESKMNKIEDALYQINEKSGNYASKDEIPTLVSQLENDAKYVTESKLTINNTTNNATNNAKFAKKDHTHDEYLTEHQDISHLAPITYVDEQIRTIELTPGPQGEQGPMGPQGIPGKDADPLQLEGYATEGYVDEAISKIEGGNVDLTGYATEAYVDQALTNYPTHKEMKSAVKDMVTSSMSDMPDIMEMSGQFFASNYFTEDDYKDGLCKVVLFNDVVFAGDFRRGELVRMTLGWDKATSTGTITIDSMFGMTEIYSVQADDSLMIESRKTFATDDTINSILGKRNYATQDYVNEMLGDIESLLGGI